MQQNKICHSNGKFAINDKFAMAYNFNWGYKPGCSKWVIYLQFSGADLFFSSIDKLGVIRLWFMLRPYICKL